MYLIIDEECAKDSIYWEDIFTGAFNSLKEAKEELEHIFNRFVNDEDRIVGNNVERTETSIRFDVWNYGVDITDTPPTVYHYVIYEAKEVQNA